MHKEEYINNFRLNPRADQNSALKADGGSCWLKLNSKLKLNSVLFPYKTFTGCVSPPNEREAFKCDFSEIDTMLPPGGIERNLTNITLLWQSIIRTGNKNILVESILSALTLNNIREIC